MKQQLVERAQQGDLDAFGHLVTATQEKSYRLASMLAGESDAADICQDAYVQAWRNIRALRAADKFDGWLRAIIVACARKSRRNKTRRATVELTAEIPAQTDTADLSPLHAAAVNAIAQLPPEFREVMILRHAEQLSMQEIAETLHCPVGTACSRLHRACNVLNEQLKSLRGELL